MNGENDFHRTPVAQSGGLFRFRYNSTVAFAAGILLFLLPFSQLKCGSVVIAENSGIGLATGNDWKMYNIPGTATSSSWNSQPMPMKPAPNWFMLLALIFAAGGLILSLIGWEGRLMACMSAGLLALTMLLGGMIYLNTSMKPLISSSDKSGAGGKAFADAIHLQITAWYYLSLASFACAAFFSYKHHMNELRDKAAGMFDFEFQGQTPVE